MIRNLTRLFFVIGTILISNISESYKFISHEQGVTDNYCYRPQTEYDGKVMFSVCLFTGGPRGTPLMGAPRGIPPQLGGGGAPPGVPPINFDKNVGQILGQKMGKVLDKKWTKFWTKKMDNILETFGGGGCGRNASCSHAGGLSCWG